MPTTELSAPRRLRPPLTLSRMNYVRLLQEEAMRLADEARAILSCDPLDDFSIEFQVTECTRRCQRLNSLIARGVDG